LSPCPVKTLNLLNFPGLPKNTSSSPYFQPFKFERDNLGNLLPDTRYSRTSRRST
jgi:hypothetical protein